MSSSIRESGKNDENSHIISYWEGNYTGTFQFDENVNDNNFQHDFWIPSSISEGNTITAELSVKKISDYTMISVKSLDGGTNWNFTVDSSSFSSLSVEFHSSIFFLEKYYRALGRKFNPYTLKCNLYQFIVIQFDLYPEILIVY